MRELLQLGAVMTIEEILATGRYTDRRGRDWAELTTVWLLLDPWRWPDKPKRESMTVSEMRLLIERDMHRDECPGIRRCDSHPVHFVQVYRGFPVTRFVAYGPNEFDDEQAYFHTLSLAVDAARALAVPK